MASMELQRRTGNKVGSRWPSLTKEQAITLGWLILMLMYIIEFFTDFKVNVMFAGTMFGFQGLDVANKINKRKGK